MKQKLLFSLIFSTFFSTSFSQEKKDWGSLQFSAGTLLFYNTLNLGYESPTLLELNEKHALRISINTGGWNLNLAHLIKGTQLNANIHYLFGSNAHHLEATLGGMLYYTRGLKEQPFAYLHRLPRLFIGYRYDKTNKRFYWRAGIGLYEAVQFGIGWKLKK